MSTEVSSIIKSQLDSIDLAVKEVASLSTKVNQLAKELNEHGKLSVEQLTVFQSATSDAHKVLEGLFRNSAKIDEFISVGNTVSTEIHEEVLKLNQAVVDATKSLDAVLERFDGEVNVSLDHVRKTSSELQSNFAVAIGHLQGTLADTKRQLNETLEVVSAGINDLLLRSTSEIGLSAQQLVETTESIRVRLGEMPNSVEAQILERLEPGMASFVSTLNTGSSTIAYAVDSVTTQVARVAEKSSEELSGIITRHDAVITRHETVSNDLRGFLDNSAEFMKMSKLLGENKDLVQAIEKGLSDRQTPFADRLGLAICGALVGYLIGHFIFALESNELVGTLGVPTLLALFNPKITRSIQDILKRNRESGWTPPAPPTV